MELQKDSNYTQYLFIPIVIGVFFYFIFPFWMIGNSSCERIILFIFFVLYFVLNGFVFKLILKDKIKEKLYRPVKGLGALINENRILISFYILAVLLHIYPMRFPIEANGDEHEYIIEALSVFSRLSYYVDKISPFSLSFIIKILTVSVLLIVLKCRKIVLKALKNKFVLPVLICIITIYSVILTRLDNVNLAGIIHYVPISKFVLMHSLGLFGITEWGVRVNQLLFALLSSVYIFRLAELFIDKKVATIASIVLLFIPGFFYYGNFSYLVCGITFFIIANSYYFLRYLKTGNVRDGYLSFIIISLGFFYERFLAFLLILNVAFMFTFGYKFLRERRLELAKFSWICAAPILPYLFLSYRLINRKYGVGLGNLLSLSRMTEFFRELPEHITLVLSIAFLLGVIVALIKKRDIFLKYFLFSFFAWYMFFTMEQYGGVLHRHATVVYPNLILYSVFFLTRIPNKLFGNLAISVLVGLLVLNCTILDSPFLKYKYITYIKTKDRYLPYDKALSYIKENVPEGKRILATMGPNPGRFYEYKFDMVGMHDWLRYDTIWAPVKKQNLSNLYSFCRKKDISYVMFPKGEWLLDKVNKGMVEKLALDKDRRFKKVAAFNSGINEIILCEVKL